MIHSFTLRIVFSPVLLLRLNKVMVKVVDVTAHTHTQVFHQVHSSGLVLMNKVMVKVVDVTAYTHTQVLRQVHSSGLVLAMYKR